MNKPKKLIEVTMQVKAESVRDKSITRAYIYPSFEVNNENN